MSKPLAEIRSFPHFHPLKQRFREIDNVVNVQMNINKLILNIFNLKFKFFPFVSINPDFEQYSVGIATIFKV